MPRRKSDDAWLWDMLVAAREVQMFVEGRTWADYEREVGLRRQVERSIEIVGEAARKVSEEFRAAHPEIPWSKIVRQRHRIAHEYDMVNDALIWRVATTHIPELVRQLEPIVPAPPSDPNSEK